MDLHDHRAIANRLDLFHQQEEGPGMVFWHPRGFALFRVIEDHVRRHMRAAGYREVRTPQLLARSLWEQSGHWEKFGENMFALNDDDRAAALKPMSCPGHIQIFNKRVRSFRDLPLRLAEFGMCHRHEPSGALHGIMRLRAFTQDDAHVFCAEDQVVAEVARFAGLLRRLYADFGFDDIVVGFSTRPQLRAGSDEAWDKAEAMLSDAARAAGLEPDVKPGEGAFYGPKLEFGLRDRLGRVWQCGTAQMDFVLPERLDAHYVDADNSRVRPVIIHHAALGSIERFIGILLEQHDGRLPLWLAPEQVLVASIGPEATDAAGIVAQAFGDADLRVALDQRPERLGRKVVRAREEGIPVLAAIGRREAEEGTVSLRWPDGGQERLALSAAISRIAQAARPGTARL